VSKIKCVDLVYYSKFCFFSRLMGNDRFRVVLSFNLLKKIS